MANLSVPQLLNLIRSPRNRALIQLCWEQHQRLKYHVEPVDKARNLNAFAHNEAMGWVAGLLPKDKFEQYKKYLRYPLPTVEISEKVHTELGRALEAENQYIRAEFSDPANAMEFDEYRASLGENDFWQTDGMELVKTQINSVIIVDLPTEQTTERPAPYYHTVEIGPNTVWDVAFKKDGQAEYIIFPQGKDILYAYDDSYFRIFERPNGSGDWQLRENGEIRHSVFSEAGQLLSGLGYCPARRFWDDLMSNGNHIQAKAPLAKVFGRLDEFNFDFYSGRYAGAGGSWGIMWAYEDTEPKHQHPEFPGVVCQSKYWHVPQNDSNVDGKIVHHPPRLVPCADCLKSEFVGPGTIKYITPPMDREDADLRNPLGFINPDSKLIDSAETRLEKAKQSIIDSVCGRGTNVGNAQAQNEDQIHAGFEEKQSYLLKFKRNVESVRAWVIKTLARFQYPSTYLRNSVDMGSEWYLQSDSELSDNYSASKKAGLPSYMLSPLREKISDTRNKGNDEGRVKQRILSHLQPYPDRSDTELQAWAGSVPEALNVDLLALSLNFDAYIRRFEREQSMSIVDFGSLVAFDTKIEIIRGKLMEYVEADKGKAPAKTAAPPAQPPTV